MLTLSSRDFLKRVGAQKVTQEYLDRQAIYSQGDPANAIFHILNGNVKLVVTSPHGKHAVTAILGPGDVFGESCLVKRSLRLSTAMAIQFSTIARVNRTALVRMIRHDPTFARHLISRLLSRMVRVQEDFADRLFNFSERRLARILLRLTHLDQRSRSDIVLPRINQEHLAQMVGTTRSRVSHFLNEFRKLGLVDYQTRSGLTVHRDRLKAMLQE
ncbi:MAG TPA: Crp/Fnr family transcriptional regulator [Terriglobia bacterium]|nr:Crp/Fnr family transcriptional regulator [Terriglobia bacterium]